MESVPIGTYWSGLKVKMDEPRTRTVIERLKILESWEKWEQWLKDWKYWEIKKMRIELSNEQNIQQKNKKGNTLKIAPVTNSLSNNEIFGKWVGMQNL